MAFNINLLVMKGITIEAVSYAPFQQGIDLIASGKLVVDDLFGDVYTLDGFAAAFDAVLEARAGKIFLSANGKCAGFLALYHHNSPLTAKTSAAP